MWTYDANESIATFDEGWQYPAITEKHASMKIRELNLILPFQYVGFPWATLIDFENRALIEHRDKWLENLKSIKLENQHARKITVAQHISAVKRIHFFKEIGITDIFWSHATSDLFIVDGIRIHAMPLYPVQVPELDMVHELQSLESARDYLFSFVGTYSNKGYVSDIRKIILDSFAHPEGKIISRKEWHYEKIVYQKQIANEALAKDFEKTYQDNSLEYKQILAKSTFSLCPSGSGPNSIRLWESIGAISIPVIFSDNLRLPGSQKLWQNSVIHLGDKIEDPKTIIKNLEEISKNPSRLKVMREGLAQLWMQYGHHNFIYDIKKLAGLV